MSYIITCLDYKRQDNIFLYKKVKYRIYIKFKGKRLDLQGIEYLLEIVKTI